MKTYDLFGEVPEQTEALGTTPRAYEGGAYRDKAGQIKVRSGLATYAKMIPTPAKADGERGSLTYYRGEGNPMLLGYARSPTSTFSSADSPARILAWQARERASREQGAVFGGSSTDLSVSYDRDTSSWKTSLPSLFGGYLPYSERFPRSGMMRNGRLFRRPRLAPRTLESASSLWPTPNVPNGGRAIPPGATIKGGHTPTAYRDGKKFQVGLRAAVQMWPTPTASDGNGPGRHGTGGAELRTTVQERRLFPTPSSTDHKGSSQPGQRWGQLTDPAVGVIPAGGSLNPRWVEWLMGFPDGWTDLER